MAIYKEDIVDIDLNDIQIHRKFLNRTIGEGDKLANRFGVRVFRDGAAENLNGVTCSGFFIRCDGGTIPLTGAISGNTAYVDLLQACYAYDGNFSLAIKLTGGNVTGTMRIIDGTVLNTTTDTAVDPGTIIPSLETILTQIQQAEQTLPSDWTGLNFALQLDGQEEPQTISAGMYTKANTILYSDGTEYSFNGYSTTPYIPILDRDMFFQGGFFTADAYNTFCLYDAGFTFITGIKGDQLIHASDYPTARYFRASRDSSDSFYVIVGTKRSYKYISDEMSIYRSPELVKLPESYYTITGLLSGDGSSVVSSFTGYKTTPFIEIPEGKLYCSGGFFPAAAYSTFCLYNSSKTMIGRGTGNEVINMADYPTAKYYRASTDIGVGSFFASFSSADPRTAEREIHVGSGQQYTTLRAGITEAVAMPNTKVIVHPGTYNLATEFSDIIQSQPSGLQGLKLENNVHVLFMAGAKVTALFPTSNSWINTYFNPFYGKDFILEGLDIEASNCRYIVHDEQSGQDVTYHNVYKNCKMKMTANGTTGTYCQCIGGGLGKHGYIEIIGGKYESIGQDGAGESPAISYHNSANDGAESKFFIRDLYLDGTGGYFRFGYHGISTIKTPVYISGCSMKASILERAEASGDAVDNFDIIAWNNTIRG